MQALERRPMSTDPIERKNISLKRSLLKDFEAYAERQRRPFSTQLAILMEAALRNEEDVIDAEMVRQRQATGDYISSEQFWNEFENEQD